MKLTVLTPDATLLETEVENININAVDESFTILKRHAPLISVVKDFVATIKTEQSNLKYIAANAGTLNVLHDAVTIFIDYGVVGISKEDAREKLNARRKELIAESDEVDDDVIARMELELIRRMGELRG